jgi:putative ubiquitin-RnfH superfamily antitoxin RatB of RatAB toxin-antitoxin module
VSLRVWVVAALPEGQDVIELELPDGAAVADALRAARIAERHPQLADAPVGIWARRVDRDEKLRDGDRVEVYRELRADAKSQRRERARALRTSSTRSRSGP